MKRFTETEKWSDPWFRKLPTKLKCFWLYILDQCDCAGAWDSDIESASFHIGESITENEVMDSFNGRIIILDCGKWWVTKFCAYQYKSLSWECIPHKQVIERLSSLGLLEESSLPTIVPVGYAKGSPTLKDKDKDKDKDKEGESEGKLDWEAILAHWNMLAKKHGLPGISKMTDDRKKKYKTRTGQGKTQDEFWRVVERELGRLNDFARGDSDRSWIMNFDFIIRSEASFTKFSEGAYSEKKAAIKTNTRPPKNLGAQTEKGVEGK